MTLRRQRVTSGMMQARGRRGGRQLLLAVSTLTMLVAIPRTGSAFGWSLIDAKIRHDFPQVKRITTVELATWLENQGRARPVLLDVRTRAEYEVSHLASAQQIEPDASVAAIKAMRKDEPIVTYCSVGYRSGAFAQRLLEAGFTNVVNLEGSIFRWANEGRPVVRAGRRVEKVHPYNRTWGLLLEKRYRADLVAAD